MKAFMLELFKTRRKRLWLVVGGMAALQGLWLLWAMGKDKQQAQGFACCLYQFPLINAIVMPIVTAVLVSRLCDLEHRGNALKALLTMERPTALFLSKLGCAAAYLAAGVLAQLGEIALIGWAYGFLDVLPARDALLYFAGQWLTSLLLALLLQGLALRFVNQFIALVAGLLLGFLGLMSLFFPPWVMRLVPSAYYGLLSTVCMLWEPATRAVDYYYVPFSSGDFFALAAVFAALCCFECRAFAQREV